MLKSLQYLIELEINNNREWFNENKNKYHEAYLQFESLINCIIRQVSIFDTDIKGKTTKELIYRMQRDIRFSNDKTPYNPTFRAMISKYNRQFQPVGCYIFISPGDRSFISGGLYSPVYGNPIKILRDDIYINGDVLKKIIGEEDFKKHFTLEGEKLKKTPHEYEPDHNYAEYLKYKNYYVYKNIEDKLIIDEKRFIEHFIELYKAMKPFNEYINNLIKDIPEPEKKKKYLK